MQINTHLFLVHDDLIPNITPALDTRFRPCNACLLTSPTTSDQAERLEMILKNAGVKVSRWQVNDSWDCDHLRERVLEFVASHGDGEIALNVSGGTKPMSLAAYEVFRYADKPIYYVHPERDHVIWLHPREWESFDLADRIKLPAYLTAHGMRLVKCESVSVPENLRQLTSALVKGVDRFEKPLTILNALAKQAEICLESPPIDMLKLQDPDMQELLGLFSSNGLLKVDSNNRLQFASEYARFYANGGWMEEHVYSVLYHLRKEIPTIQDLARNVQIEWDVKRSDVNNELDVTFLADNKLYIIECKTKKFDQSGNPDSDAAGVLYKLDTLRDYLGGVGAKAMLVSYRDISKVQKERAEEFSVRICDGNSIVNIGAVLRRWIGDKPNIFPSTCC